MGVPTFTVAGAMGLQWGDTRVLDDDFGGRQLRTAASILLIDRHTPVPVQRLVDALWPAGPPEQYRTALRGLVSKVRGLVARVGFERECLRTLTGQYVVDLPGLEVDLEQAHDALQRARGLLDSGDFGAAAASSGEARAVLSRPILPGVDADWMDELRDRVRREHLESLLVLGACRSHEGRTRAARTIAGEAIDLAPLREDAWRLAMHVEAASGNVGRALSLYERLRRSLAEELGTDPSRATQDLHTRILLDVPDPSSAVGPAARRGSHATARPVAASANPYPGLRSYDVDEAVLFFGREAATQQLIERLARHRAVAVVGPSGVGKSSLVRAGLLPALDRGAVPDADTWRVALVKPGRHPLDSLAEAVLATSRRAGHLDAASASAMLRADPLGLHELLGDDPEGSPTTLLVVDQAEELFTLSDPDEGGAFVASILATLSASGPAAPRLAVVWTMRADFYAQAAADPGLAAFLSRSQFVVSPLRGDGLQSAIVQPARLAGVDLEDGLLGRLVAEVGTRPGGLPLLQHVLRELWDHREDDRLTISALERLGGVGGALARHAEETWQALDDGGRQVARRILLRAVSPTSTGATAAPVHTADLSTVADAADVDRVVATMVDARLMTASDGRRAGTPGRTGSPTLELAHEALLREWPRLRRWIDDERETLLVAVRIRDLAADWEQSHRDPSHLLRGTRLAEVERHDGLLDVALTEIESAYVRTSIAARTVAQEEARRRRAVEQAGRLAVHAMTTRSEDPELSTLLGLASVAHSRRHGLAPEPGAVGALHRAVQATRLVRRVRAGGSRLVAASPDGSWVAVDRDATCLDPVVIDVATGASRTLPGPTVPPGADLLVGLCALTAHPDGTRLAAGYDHDPDAQQTPNRNSAGHHLPPVVVFDVADGTVDQVLDGPPGFYWSLSFRADGSLLAAADGVRTVVVWDTESWDVAATHEIGRDIAQVAFDPATGDLLVMCVDPPGLVRADPRTGERLQFLELPWGGQNLFAVHPQGESVALGHPGRRVVEIRDLATWKVIHAWPAPLAMCAAWSPDGRSVAHAGSRGVITVRDVATGRRTCELAGSTTVRTIAFLGDSDHLVNPTWDGQTLVWNASPAGRPLLQAIATDGGTIDRFWVDDTESTVGIATHDPPAFRLMDATTGRRIQTIELAMEIHALVLDGIAAVASDGLEQVAALRPDGRCTIHEPPGLGVVAELDRLGLPLAVDASGRYVALNAIDRDMPSDDRALTCEIWDVDANQPCVVDSHGAGSVAFTRPAGSQPPLVAISSNSRDVHLHDLREPTHMGTLALSHLDRSFFAGLAFSPDGRLLAGETQEGTAWVVDIEAVRRGSSMADAIVFQTTTYQGPTTHPVLTDTGLLATVGFDAHLRLWDIQDDELVAEFGIDLGPDQIPTLQLSPDQQALLYVESGTVVRRFPLEVDELVALAERAVTRGLTDDERHRHGLGDARA